MAILRLSQVPQTCRQIRVLVKTFLTAMATDYANCGFAFKVASAQDVTHAALERWFKASNVAQPQPGRSDCDVLALNDLVKEFANTSKSRINDWHNAPPKDKGKVLGHVIQVKNARNVCAHHGHELNRKEDVEKTVPVMFTEGYGMIQALSDVPAGDLRKGLEGDRTKMGHMLVGHEVKEQLNTLITNSTKETSGSTLGKRKTEEEPTAAGALGNGGEKKQKS